MRYCKMLRQVQLRGRSGIVQYDDCGLGLGSLHSPSNSAITVVRLFGEGRREAKAQSRRRHYCVIISNMYHVTVSHFCREILNHNVQ
jgi:hypothetical protein